MPKGKIPKHPIPRSEFSFSADIQTKLTKFGFDMLSLVELEECVYTELCFLIHSRSIPESRKRKDRLKSLGKALDRVASALNNIDEHTLRTNFDLQRSCFLTCKAVDKLILDVDNAIAKKEKSGNSETDLDALVYSVAKVMLKNAIMPKRYGTDFSEIVKIVFSAIGEEGSAVSAAIEKAWTVKPSNPTAASWRAGTIEELIEQSLDTNDLGAEER